jgi:hypothetical protein
MTEIGATQAGGPAWLRPGLLAQQAPLTTLDEEAREAEVVFSTGALVPHFVMHEGQLKYMPTRAVISEEACDLEFLTRAGPLLDTHFSHHTSGVIGSVVSARIEDGRCLARVRFADTEDVTPIWEKVRQGHLRNVSAGFEVLAQEMSRETGPDGKEMEVMLFTRWRPLELSMVPVPADLGSQVQSRGAPRAQEPAATAAQEAARAAQPQTQEKMMSEHEQGAAQVVPNEIASAVDTQAVMQQAARAERARIAGIEDVAQKLKVDAALVRQAREDGTSVEDFRAAAIDAFAQAGEKSVQGIGGPRIEVTADARDRFRQGAELGLMARVGLGGERNEFTGMTLSELARQSLDVANVKGHSSRFEMVGAAFMQAGAHSTSDFANILANVAQKAALKGWTEAEETYQMWTSAGTLTDFRPAKRAGLGLIDALPEKIEGADYEYGTVGDRGETITLATYGKILKITREAVMDDDLSLFSTLPVRAGRAARRTIGNLCYAVLTNNPTMADGTALFHADHGNLAAPAAAMSKTSLSKAKAAMRTQKESATGSALNITPAYLVVPAALEETATQLMFSRYDPDANKGHAINPVAGMAHVVTDARLDDDSATAFYLVADPARFDTVEVAYLDGVQEPFIEQKTAWSSDGVELKVRIDAGVAPLDHRTFYKNAGA